MKYLFFMTIFCSSIFCGTELQAQTYTTESKSCGSCGKAVSVNSRVGMYCPHCGVRWGYENEKRKSTTTYKNKNDYSSTKSTGITTSKVNLRSLASTSSAILTQIPAYTTVSIISRTGDWYYVNYIYYKGYVYKTLLK